MYITLDKITIQFDEQELRTIALALKHDIDNEEVIDHCARHGGWNTFCDNHNPALYLLEEFSNRLGMTLHDDAIRSVKAGIEQLQKELEDND